MMKILRKIGLVFFTISLLFLALLLTSSFLIKVSIRPSSIQKYILENDFSFIIKDSSGEDSALIKETKSFLNELGISKTVVESLVQSDVIKKYMSDYTVKYILYYLGEDNKPEFNSTLFKKIIKENIQIAPWLFSGDSKASMLKKQKMIEEKIDLYATDVLDFFPTVKSFIKRLESEKTYFGVTIHQVLKLISLLISKKWIIVCIVMFWISLIMMFVCGLSLKSVYKALFVATFSYTSILIVLEIILGTVVKTSLMNRLEVANVFINYMVNVLSKGIWVFVIVGILCSIFFKKFPDVKIKKSLTTI